MEALRKKGLHVLRHVQSNECVCRPEVFCDKCQMLCAVIAENKDVYNMCNEQFGKCVKLEVLVFKEHVDRMKEGPNDIN